MRCAVVVPVKSFTDAKARLAGVLTAAQRERLARTTAGAVVDATRSWSPHVVCDDPAVAAWAGAYGAVVVADQSRDLDGAVSAGIEAARAAGFDHVAIVHGDLVRPSALGGLLTRARPGAVTLVPDAGCDGTNVAIVPTDVGWRPAYGRGSFLRHLEAAQRMSLPVEVVRDRDLALDIDGAADLRHPLVASVVEEILGAEHDAAPSTPIEQSSST